MIINTTPHDVLVQLDGNKYKKFPKAETPARITSTLEKVGILEEIPTVKAIWGDVKNLPAEKEGTYYIVSTMIKDILPNRKDLLVPENLIRDDEGNIIACKTFRV